LKYLCKILGFSRFYDKFTRKGGAARL